MDIRFFSDIIKEVLVRDSVACLPGLGSLSLVEVPAFFSDKGFTVNPPYIKPVFNPEIKDDMGLVDFYARNNDLSRAQALNLITVQLKNMETELRAAKSLQLPGLGYMRIMHDGGICFVADESLAIFQNFELLEPVSLRYLPSIQQIGPKAEAPRVEEPAVEAIPLAEVPALETPALEEVTVDEVPIETPVAETPAAEAHVTEAPAAEPPVAEAPAVETPVAEAPAVETPVAEAPDVENQAAEALNSETPATPTRRKAWKKFAWSFFILVAAVGLMAAALAYLGRNYPELVDPLLYSAEELEILNTVL